MPIYRPFVITFTHVMCVYTHMADMEGALIEKMQVRIGVILSYHFFWLYVHCPIIMHTFMYISIFFYSYVYLYIFSIKDEKNIYYKEHK